MARRLVALTLAAACAAPAMAQAEKKAKPKKKKAPAAEVVVPTEPPPPPPPAAESTTIEPRVTYRASSLQTNRDSVYWKKEYTNNVDQLYATLRFARSFDYRHDVVVEPTFRTVRDNPSRMDGPLLEQAYVDSAIWRNLSLTAGKKTEYDGSGFMVNPSDLLNEDKDLFDPLYQQEGKIFTRLRYKWDFATVGLGFVPQRGSDAKTGRGWLQIASDVADADLKVQLMHQGQDKTNTGEKTTTGFSLSRYFGERFELHWDGRYQSRQRDPGKAGERWRKYSAYQFQDPSGYYLAGTRFVITGRRTLILEGIQQQSGLNPEDMERYHDALRDDAALGRIEEIPTRLQGRRYGFVSYQDDDTVKGMHFGASYLRNLQDESYFATANGVYHLSPISSIEVNTMLFKGPEQSEFGAMPFPRALHLIVRGKF